MFELGREFIIESLHGPLVFEKFRLVGSFVDHRLYREDHARFHDSSSIFRGLMIDIGFFVELDPDTMPRVFSYDSVALFLGVFRYRESDISYKIPRPYFVDSEMETILGYFNDFLGSGTYFSDDIHLRSIAVVSIEDNRDVDIQDISFPEEFMLIGDSMTDSIIQGDAGIFRISMIADTG